MAMDTEWKVGDLALCIRESFPLKKGHVYKVSHITNNRWLFFKSIPVVACYCDLFKKYDREEKLKRILK